ncbi:neprilysin-1-like isoform X3 [Dermacentor albipictus]|uniref:neprilysin-1-like isoform X3 n=1 Tax=Dermacentor albipictus TaxID=60249 RepID=UPI0031FCE7E9
MKKQAPEAESGSGTGDKSGTPRSTGTSAEHSEKTQSKDKSHEVSGTGSAIATERPPAAPGATVAADSKEDEQANGARVWVPPPLDLPSPPPLDVGEPLQAAPELPPRFDLDMPLPSAPETRRTSQDKPVVDEPVVPKPRRGVFKFPFFKTGGPSPAPQQEESTTTTADPALSSQMPVSVFPDSASRTPSLFSRITGLLKKQPPAMKNTLATIPEDHTPGEPEQSTLIKHSVTGQPFREQPPVQVYQAMADTKVPVGWKSPSARSGSRQASPFRQSKEASTQEKSDVSSGESGKASASPGFKEVPDAAKAPAPPIFKKTADESKSSSSGASGKASSSPGFKEGSDDSKAPAQPGFKKSPDESKSSGSAGYAGGGSGSGVQEAWVAKPGEGQLIAHPLATDVPEPLLPPPGETAAQAAPETQFGGAGDYGRGQHYSWYPGDSRVEHLQWQVRCVQLILTGLVIFVFVTIVLCALNVFGCRNPPSFPNIYMINETTSCISDGCKDFVSRFSDTALPMVDPCEDFYEHVCGGWLLRTQVPLDAFDVSIFSETRAALNDDAMDKLNHTLVSYRRQNALQKAAAFYLGCLNIEMRNTKGVKPLIDLLQKHNIPRWPMVQGRVADDVITTLGHFIREVGLNAIVSVRVGVDQTENQKHIIYIGEPEFGVERSVLRGKYRSPYFRILHRYKVYMYRSALILGATVAAADLINEIVAFEGRLAAAVSTSMSNPTKTFRTISLESLETALPLVKWTLFLNNILKDTQLTLDMNDKVVVTNQEYLRRMSLILKEEPPYVVVNYIAWRVVQLLGPLSIDRLRHAKFRFDRYRYSLFQIQQLSRQCFDLTFRYMRFAVGRILYDRDTQRPLERHAKLQEMADDVKDAFAILLDLVDWMSAANKKAAIYKLREMKVNAGFPLWIRSDTELNEYYSSIPDLRKEEFFVSALHVIKAYVVSELRKLKFIGYRNDFGSVNFGALGTILGHYMTLGLSAHGAYYDYKGNLDEWWTPKMRRGYAAGAVCFRNQADWFVNPATGEAINTTVNEDVVVADSAAVKEAFKAYRVFMTRYEELYKLIVIQGMETYTQDQIFFVSYAMTMCEKSRRHAVSYYLYTARHIPNHLRTNIALMNFDRFAIAFNCPVGSPMNPDAKCDVY